MRIWENEKNTTRVEILIPISAAIRKKNNKNFGSYIRAIFYIDSYHNFKPWSNFKEMASFSKILN